MTTMQPDVTELQNRLATWREQLVTGLLYATLPVGLLALVGALNSTIPAGDFVQTIIYCAAYLAIIIIALDRRLSYILRATVFLSLLYCMGLLNLLDSGLSSDGRVFLLTLPVIATILLDRKVGIVSLGLSMVTLVTIGWAMCTGVLPITVEATANSTDPRAWFSGSAVMLLLAVIMLVPLSHLLQGQLFAVQSARQNQALQETQTALGEINTQLQQELNERKSAEAALIESEEKYRLVVETANEWILVAQDGMLKFCNSKALEFLGYTAGEAAAKPFITFIHPADRGMVLERHVKRLKGETLPPFYTFRIVHKSGSIKWVEMNVAVIIWEGKPATLNFLNDITVRKQAEERLKASLKEKEVLLQEIHHRVKNNLQVISSLLNLQAGYVDDPQTLSIFRDSQHRIRSMALIHEKLYQSKNLAQIDFADYIRDLGAYLVRSQNACARGVSLNIQADDVFLGIDTAVPCGLILNELVSNTLKHAFPNGRSGKTRIKLTTGSEGRLTLVVGDNGVGFPADVDFRESETLGLQLVNSLVEQLDGAIEMKSASGGTEFKITFAVS